MDKIEFWYDGSWKQLSTWNFGINYCPLGCWIISLGWWGFTILNEKCVELYDGEDHDT